MSRYDSVCQLVEEIAVKDTRGVVSTSETPRDVFCNVFSIGDAAFYSAVVAGFHPDARLQVRKADYRGEKKVVFEGTTFFVSRVDRSSPDFVTLTLTERLGER